MHSNSANNIGKNENEDEKCLSSILMNLSSHLDVYIGARLRNLLCVRH